VHVSSSSYDMPSKEGLSTQVALPRKASPTGSFFECFRMLSTLRGVATSQHESYAVWRRSRAPGDVTRATVSVGVSNRQ